MVRSDSCVLAGEGPLTKLSIVIPVYNERYLVGELHDLGNLIRGKPYMAAARLDIEEPNAVAAMGERFDTVLGLHLLERVAEPAARLLPWRGLGMIAAARQPH